MRMKFQVEIWLNERKKFNPGKWLKKPKPHANQNHMPEPAAKSKTRIEHEVEVITRRIENYQIDLTCNYQDWIKLGFAFADEFGETGRNYFHRVSRFYSGYDPAGTDRQFDKCLQGKKSGVTIKTFFQAAKDAGVNIRV